MNGIKWVDDSSFVTIGDSFVIFWEMDGKNACPYLGNFSLKNKEFFDVPISICTIKV